MLIYVDIDETICTLSGQDPEKLDYSKSSPIIENITAVNNLYDAGNTIIYWTARGTKSGIDWSETTQRQFLLWGVKCHDLQFGKPAYDLFICDKVLNSRRWEEEMKTKPRT
tara:strand:- start:22390 stop:22722 length:333 start_codon:yes stop_codon:yes gene_type:complete